MTLIVDTPLVGDIVTNEGIPTEQFQALLESIALALNEPSFPSYTVSTAPDATLNETKAIYVSDEAGGKTLAFSDGVNWRRVQDRAIIT